MEKLLKYLERFKEGNRAVAIHPVKFGSNYFHPSSVKVDAVQCVFGFGTDYTQKERQIIKYCNRYNYAVVFSGFNNHCSWFYIMNNDIRYKLFNAMKNDLSVMAEHNNSYMSLFKELKNADDEIINTYKEIYL